ncbi:MAG: neutral zinc metallopeptidase [Chitinophagaceae bacterium]|nr:neutral zinc metallopeptidase [Chitinophagaceae bacterium]MCB9046306.1 neutral zinc metallopeptidase [Chitinophagales bacterium]
MRWQGRRESSNVEDRRSGGSSGKMIGGGVGVLVIAAIVYFLGGDPTVVLQQAGDLQSSSTEQYTPDAAENEAAQFVSVVLAETEDFWHREFADMGYEYKEPTLVLFHSSVESGCGQAGAASGPFYCPLDQKVYIDLSFYDELHGRFGAPGDFAMAYVVAHEVGHHVQTLLGISEKVRALKESRSEVEANKLSVMQELQADFFAGMWAHYTDRMQNILDEGDIDEALNAANAIGDDRLQKRFGNGTVVPDAFTHGTSAQRVRWFKKGYDTGDISQGDTFGTREL